MISQLRLETAALKWLREELKTNGQNNKENNDNTEGFTLKR